MSMSIYLKKADNSDIEELVELEKSVAEDKTSSIIPSTMDEWAKDIKNGVVYLIQKDNVVVGDIQYEKKGEGHMQITGLVVKPQFQRQGIAREALTQVLEELKNFKRIDLTTHPENIKARALYKSLGFVEESRKENFYGDGEPRLILVLEKNS